MRAFLPRPKAIAAILAVALAALGLTIACSVGAARLIRPDTLAATQAFFARLGGLGWLLLFAIQVARVLLPVLPAEPFELLAGAIYGGLLGTLTCLVGILLGSLLARGVTRKFGRRILGKVFSPQTLAQYQRLLESPAGDKISFLIYLLPGTPKDSYTYILGMSDISWGKFVFLVTIVRLPSVLSSTWSAHMVMRGGVFWGVWVYLLVGVISIFGVLIHKKLLQKNKQENL